MCIDARYRLGTILEHRCSRSQIREMCSAAGLVDLPNRHLFQLQPATQRIFSRFSLQTIASGIGLAAVVSSTAVDQLAPLTDLSTSIRGQPPTECAAVVLPEVRDQSQVLLTLTVLVMLFTFEDNALLGYLLRTSCCLTALVSCP